MRIDDLIKSVNSQHVESSRAPLSSRFRDMLEGWLISGANVAAIFDSRGTFIQATKSEYEAKAKAVGLRNSGMKVVVKRITV